MNDHRMLNRVLKVAIAGLVVLGLTACKQRQTHAEAKNAAENRWLSARSQLLLQSAQRYFDTGDLTQCERTLAEALTFDPGNAELHTLLGRVHLEHGKLERAYQRFDGAIELDEKLPTAYYYKGIVLERWQRYEAALEAYGKAFELQSDNVAYLLSVAQTHVALDDLAGARDLLASKLIYFDQNAGIRVAIARIYAMEENFTQAASYMAQAQLLQPDDLRVVEELAFLQMSAGDFRKAMSHLERLCADPAFVNRLDLLSSLASCYAKVGRAQQAHETYLKLARRDPQNGEPWVRLAEMAFAEGKLNDALHAANRAISLTPERHEGYLIAGMVFHKRGSVEQALRMFDSAAKAAPEDAMPLILRGLTLEQAGRRDEAIAAYTQALEVQPQDTRARRLLANVQTQ